MKNEFKRIYQNDGTYFDEPLTEADRELEAKDLMEFNLRKQAEETKAAARQAVLNRLGLTEEEAQLIIGGSN
jgi:hypothetical protein